MLNTIRATIKDGKVELLEQINIPEGTQVLVTPLTEEHDDFWIRASEASAMKIWDNADDDVYGDLLKK